MLKIYKIKRDTMAKLYWHSMHIRAVAIYRATWRCFKPKIKKGKWDFLAHRLKTFLYFLKKNFSYISGNFLTSSLKKSGGNFPSSKNKKNTLKKFLIFWEMEVFSPKLKNSYIFLKSIFSYISGGNLRSSKK